MMVRYERISENNIVIIAAPDRDRFSKSESPSYQRSVLALRASACVASAAAANSHSFQLGRRAFSLAQKACAANQLTCVTG